MEGAINVFGSSVGCDKVFVNLKGISFTTSVVERSGEGG